MNDNEQFELWTRVLESYEHALDHYELALDDSTTLVKLDQLTTFVPPADLPPLPGALRDRAIALAARTDGLVTRASVIAAEALPGRAPMRHRRVRHHVALSTFDQRG
jgi:hypothetical protein